MLGDSRLKPCLNSTGWPSDVFFCDVLASLEDSSSISLSNNVKH